MNRKLLHKINDWLDVLQRHSKAYWLCITFWWHWKWITSQMTVISEWMWILCWISNNWNITAIVTEKSANCNCNWRSRPMKCRPLFHSSCIRQCALVISTLVHSLRWHGWRPVFFVGIFTHESYAGLGVLTCKAILCELRYRKGEPSHLLCSSN